MILAQHQRLIEQSAISADVAAERGYWSASNVKELGLLFGVAQRRLVPALVIPTYNALGDEVFSQLRPDAPRVIDGKARKYEMPHRARMAIDVPPRVRAKLGDPATPLVITEGARKADAAVSAGLYAIDLVGVWTWRGRNDDDGLTALADFEYIALNDRVVYLTFDSDAMVKREVHGALVRLRRLLCQRGADVRIVYLPTGDGGAKVGLDDFLAGGHTRDDLLALAADELRPLAGGFAGPPGSVSTSDATLTATGELLDEITALIDRFVILPSRAAALTVALYVLHTWAFEAAHATPYLTIQSATKRAGKTRVEELLELVVRSPWRIAAASEAAMFRKIDTQRPTLLFDEVDALFGSRAEGTEPVRAILNAGNRPGAAVSRVVGEGVGMTVCDFSVFCPKVLAGIHTARWPDTVTDRSIIIGLRRKLPGEKVERLRPRKLRDATEDLRARLARWADEHVEVLRDADPTLPGGLDDRQAEAWEPLLAIAEQADRDRQGEWVARSHRAALNLAGERGDEDAHGVMLLAAIKARFDSSEVLATDAIVGAINDDEQLPFGEYRNGGGLNARKLAELLKPFEIRPRTVRIGQATAKGYRRDQFVDAWARYCPPGTRTTPATPPDSASRSVTASQANNDGGLGHFAYPSQTGNVTDRQTPKNPREHWDVTLCRHESTKPGGLRADATADEAFALASDEEEAFAERLFAEQEDDR